MAFTALSELVTDWGGFEQLIAQLHETGDVTVEHNVVLQGRSGAPRQIDVLVRHKTGLYEHLIVVECKYRNAPIERVHVDALATTIREVGASRGVIFSTHGFQSGAIAQAEHENISLFKLRELTDAEWGLPGRHIEIWLHVVSVSFEKLDMPGARGVGFPPNQPINVNISMGDPALASKTRIHAQGLQDVTLEELASRIAMQSAKAVYAPVKHDFDGSPNGESLRVHRVRFTSPSSIQIYVGAGCLIAPYLTGNVGLKVTQSKIQFDRGAPYAFVLALENCITKETTTATRLFGSLQTELASVATVTEPPPGEQIFVNGSILTVWINALQPFTDFAGRTPSDGPEITVKL